MNVAEIQSITFTLPGIPFSLAINPATLLVSWGIMVLLLLLGIPVGLRCKIKPGKLQAAIEYLFGYFITLCRDTLGEDWKRFFPLVMTLFLFVLFANVVSIIPGVQAPTFDLNTCLGLGLMVFVVVHVAAISRKGFIGYIKGYFQPFFILFPLNVLGEIGKVVSHSFRLFGNMFAGGIIIALLGPIAFKVGGILSVPKAVTSPFIVTLLIATNGFYGIFVGAIQAFVFAVLALTYIAVARDE